MTTIEELKRDRELLKARAKEMIANEADPIKAIKIVAEYAVIAFNTWKAAGGGNLLGFGLELAKQIWTKVKSDKE